MEHIDDVEFTDTDNLYVVYVHYLGTDSDGLNIYHLLVSENAEDVFAEEWGEKPACNCSNLMPEDDMYQYVKELKTEITFDLAQKNCCFSMQDCRDKCIALAHENIDEYENYPEPCRIVIQFGDRLSDVERMLAQRDLRMRYI